MSPKYDASRLLYVRSESDRFLHQLNVSEQDEALLLDARRKARKAIRIAFHESRNIILEEYNHYKNNLQWDDLVTPLDKKKFTEINPVFWSQGSYTYRTMNNPAYTPPQQFDLDDGVYLPMHIFKEEPIYSKNLFFKIIDNALTILVNSEPGWKFDNSKNTCSRIIINKTMHLDFPLYAISSEKFDKIKNEGQVIFDTALNAEFSESVNPIELDPNDVYLAVREEEHWIKSDPKRIEAWFKREINLHGRRLRRVCRYLKAWRDHTWEKGGPSSIVLMVCAVRVFNESTTFDRDCEALLAVAKKLPFLFSGDIVNPAVPEDEEEMFQSRHGGDEIKEIIEKSRAFESSLTRGLVYASSTQEVVNEFIISFGGRIPNQCHWVAQRTTVAPSGKPKIQAAPVLPVNVESGFNIETG